MTKNTKTANQTPTTQTTAKPPKETPAPKEKKGPTKSLKR